MTYNINGCYYPDSTSCDTLSLMDIIRKQKPDVLCLQEMYYSVFRKYCDSLDNYFDYEKDNILLKEDSRYFIYSRFPIRNFKKYSSLSETEIPCVDSLVENELYKLKNKIPVYSAELEVEKDRCVTVFSCHLRSNAYTTARRSMDCKKTDWKDGIPLYYKNYLIAHAIRNWEARTIRHHVDSLLALDIPVIVAGDLNDFSGSDCLNLLTKGDEKKPQEELYDAWWERGNGLGFTYDAWRLKLRLDHILVSKHFEVESVNVPHYGLSDHYPLVADISYK